MFPSEIFQYCPRCGTASGQPIQGSRLQCASCGFVFYFNPTVAAACFITGAAGKILLVKRAKEPARGKWAPPGGFIDIGERAEDGVLREIREEVGLEVTDLEFLCSQPNQYHYREVTYPVLDLFFTAKAVGGNTQAEKEEIQAAEWVSPASVALEEIAFPSTQAAFREFLRKWMAAMGP